MIAKKKYEFGNYLIKIRLNNNFQICLHQKSKHFDNFLLVHQL